MRVAIVLSGVAPAMTLMSGAMLEFLDRKITFDTISTSGVGALVGLLTLAPKGPHTPSEALQRLPDLFLSDPLARLLPVNFKVFHKHGPLAQPMREFGKLIPRWPVDPRQPEPYKRLYNDLVDLWVNALTPWTVTTRSKGLMTPLGLVDDLVDFEALRCAPGDFYLNAFNAATKRLKIFTKHELNAQTYAAGQAMGFLYPAQRFGKDVFTVGATHDPTGLQAIWMHPDRDKRPDAIICLDAMRYAYWRPPQNLYDAFQLMLLNPIMALQRNIYTQYATAEWLFNRNRERFPASHRAPPAMPRLYRIPMEDAVRKPQYKSLLDWSHASAIAFEEAGRQAARPVAKALAAALSSKDLAPLEEFRFHDCASFEREAGTYHVAPDAAGGHQYGLAAGFARTVQQAIDIAVAAAGSSDAHRERRDD